MAVRIHLPLLLTISFGSARFLGVCRIGMLQHNVVMRKPFGVGVDGLCPARGFQLVVSRSSARARPINGNNCAMSGPESRPVRSEEHTSEPPSLMRISYAVFCLKKTTTQSHII